MRFCLLLIAALFAPVASYAATCTFHYDRHGFFLSPNTDGTPAYGLSPDNIHNPAAYMASMIAAYNSSGSADHTSCGDATRHAELDLLPDPSGYWQYHYSFANGCFSAADNYSLFDCDEEPNPSDTNGSGGGGGDEGGGSGAFSDVFSAIDLSTFSSTLSLLAVIAAGVCLVFTAFKLGKRLLNRQ